MGCDIHLYVEKKNADGTWAVVEDVPCGWCDGTGVLYDKPCFICRGSKRSAAPWAEHSRHYQAFALLADVRNYHGIQPLFKGRGVPSDVSDRGAELSDEYGVDGHSHTYFTMAELQAALESAPKIPNGGFVNAREYLRWKREGKPESWCGGRSGIEVDNADMEAAIARFGTDAAESIGAFNHTGLGEYYTRVTWEQDPKDVGSGILACLERIRAEQNARPQDIRAVIFFDN